MTGGEFVSLFAKPGLTALQGEEPMRRAQGRACRALEAAE